MFNQLHRCCLQQQELAAHFWKETNCLSNSLGFGGVPLESPTLLVNNSILYNLIPVLVPRDNQMKLSPPLFVDFIQIVSHVLPFSAHLNVPLQISPYIHNYLFYFSFLTRCISSLQSLTLQLTPVIVWILVWLSLTQQLMSI